MWPCLLLTTPHRLGPTLSASPLPKLWHWAHFWAIFWPAATSAAASSGRTGSIGAAGGGALPTTAPPAAGGPPPCEPPPNGAGSRPDPRRTHPPGRNPRMSFLNLTRD